MHSAPRYDGVADYYDNRFAVYASEEASSGHLRRFLGPGAGLCLDLGCGTGLHFGATQQSGRTVLGLDVSSDQLRIARGRVAEGALLQGDGARLPIASESLPAAVATFVHTDVDDMVPVLSEVHRVLQPGGRFVYLGLHPVMWGHFVQRREDGAHIVHPGYMDTGWHYDSPNWGPESIRRKT